MELEELSSSCHLPASIIYLLFIYSTIRSLITLVLQLLSFDPGIEYSPFVSIKEGLAAKLLNE